MAYRGCARLEIEPSLTPHLQPLTLVCLCASLTSLGPLLPSWENARQNTGISPQALWCSLVRGSGDSGSREVVFYTSPLQSWGIGLKPIPEVYSLPPEDGQAHFRNLGSTEDEETGHSSLQPFKSAPPGFLSAFLLTAQRALISDPAWPPFPALTTIEGKELDGPERLSP